MNEIKADLELRCFFKKQYQVKLIQRGDRSHFRLCWEFGKTQRWLKKVQGKILLEIPLKASLTTLIQNWIFVTLNSGSWSA